MEVLDILHRTIARLQGIVVVECILGEVIHRGCGDLPKHLLRDRHVNVCPDVLSRPDVVSKLSFPLDAKLIGLVIARPENGPAVRDGIARAFNDGRILHSLAFHVHRNSLVVQRNENLRRLRSSRHRRLKGSWHPLSGIVLDLQRNVWGCILARQCLAGIENVSPRVSCDIECALANGLVQNRVVRISRVKLDEEVDRVLDGRLPLVDGCPGRALAFRDGTHGRRPRCEDKPVGRVLELGIQELGDRLLHRRTIARQEELGLNAEGLL